MDMITQVQLTWQRSLLTEQFCFCRDNVGEHAQGLHGGSPF